MPPTMEPVISPRDDSTVGINSDSDEDTPTWESYDDSAAKIKLHVRDIFCESLCASHNQAAGLASSACNIQAKWELFTAMGLAPPSEEMRETNYPSSYSYQPIPSKLPSSPSLQTIEKHHLEDDDEQNESHKRCRVVMSKGEDITEEFWTDEKELQEILNRKKKEIFHNSVSMHQIDEKYLMHRSGTQVHLVSAEKEKNDAGVEVNKELGLDYALLNMYPEDLLEQYIKALQQRFKKKDPIEEMKRIASLSNESKSCNQNTLVCICQEQASLLSVAGSLSYIARLVRTLDRNVVERQPIGKRYRED